MQDLYNRQENMGLNTNISVIVCGCGGIGFHAAKMLAMAGVPELHLFDPDTFDGSNLNRIDVDFSVVGLNKADITEKYVRWIRPECNTIAYPFPLGEHIFPTGNINWFLDCTDESSVQKQNQEMAKARRIQYVKAGYDGEHMSIDNKVASWGESTDGGYTITPSWAVPAIIVAGAVVGKILKYHDQEMSRQLPELYNY